MIDRNYLVSNISVQGVGLEQKKNWFVVLYLLSLSVAVELFVAAVHLFWCRETLEGDRANGVFPFFATKETITTSRPVSLTIKHHNHTSLRLSFAYLDTIFLFLVYGYRHSTMHPAAHTHTHGLIDSSRFGKLDCKKRPFFLWSQFKTRPKFPASQSSWGRRSKDMRSSDGLLCQDFSI